MLRRMSWSSGGSPLSRAIRNGVGWMLRAAALGALAIACGSDEDPGGAAALCSTGETRTCVGPGACQGGQSCLPDGSGFGPCDCGAATGGSGGSAGGSGGSVGIGGTGGASAGGTAGATGGSSGVGGSAAASAGASGSAGGGGSGGSGGAAGAGGLPPHCANLPGPSMVDIGQWCIDSTPVTRTHYQAFLVAKAGDTSGQIELCEDNATYEPTCAWGDQYPNRPATCVQWCDAYAYCAWAGKRLCGHKLGGALKGSNTAGAAIATDWTVSQWAHACTNGGVTLYPYANTNIIGACSCGTVSDVGSHPQCHGLQPPYSEVFDLVGNVGEWVDYQIESIWPQTNFAYVGTNPSCSCESHSFTSSAGNSIGFRCCSL